MAITYMPNDDSPQSSRLQTKTLIFYSTTHDPTIERPKLCVVDNIADLLQLMSNPFLSFEMRYRTAI